MAAKKARPDAIAERLREVMSALRRRARAEAGERALSYPETLALRRLELDGPQTTADLARAELVTPQTMGGMVQHLEENGHVERSADATDARRRVVRLTARGKKALTELRAERSSWLAREIDAHLDADEQRTLDDAVTLLRRIIDG